MLSPCKGCKDRHESCHASCEEYKKWREELDAEKARINKIRDVDVQMATYKRNKASKWYSIT